MNRTHAPYLDLSAYTPLQPTSASTATTSSTHPNIQQNEARPTRSRQPSARARLVSEQGASSQDLADITRHEDPTAPDQTHQDDGDYGERHQPSRRGPPKRPNSNACQPASSLPSSAASNTRSKNPGRPNPTRPPPIPSLGSSPVTQPELPPQPPAGNSVRPTPIIDPALLNLPPLHPPPPPTTSFPPTSQVAASHFSAWSQSSSPHGNLSPRSFQVPPQTPAAWPPAQQMMTGPPQYSSPFAGPSPFPQPVFGGRSTQEVLAVTPTENQTAQQPAPSVLPQSDTDDDDDVLGTLCNKTRKRRRRPIQLPLTVASEHGSGLVAIEADPQNISSWPAQQRPLLLLARFKYGALLNTENGAPSPSAQVRFQAEAYSRAIMSVSQSKRHGLPEKPTPTILRCIHKHCSAFRGRVKDAALEALFSIYKIQENCSSPGEVAAKVQDLLQNANFIFREITPEGRAGPWHHPAITSVVINSTFGDREAEGIITKQRYLPLVPPPVIFLACTAIQHALEMWSTGTKVMLPFKFDATRRSNYQVYKRNWDQYLDQWGEEGDLYMKETRELLTDWIRNIVDAVSDQGEYDFSSQPLSTETSFFSDTDAI
ncbi:hypothetical protein FRC04_005601 [Tulasnella sp. 424]|nr:hypothetical protein FRC04_005601 [Tulasnella sp. 424]KAG8962206.1 hypothetical protein FRC05_005477 [Tulasnella sp. 425]